MNINFGKKRKMAKRVTRTMAEIAADDLAKLSDILFDLKYDSRIKEKFPEVLPYLNFSAEKPVTSAEYDSLRNMLKK